ncbi:hypothetical protein Ade02nite_80000 [Paractinoplanes deccanensis]|uniref:Secreted protein n=1 Tax=Paractinoplanes deccanensis TaxID=113561 RepID=A0ABQ3YH81_9ACTN|nr:hypothetical protein [Actinoplanes deccanensis]GID79359.1 hypothetical protein Ade02nite_80000 [Actinoplanes deccanensis]
MRRILTAAAVAVTLVVGAAGSAVAVPPVAADPGGGWSVVDGRLTWRSAERVPMGDAAVEFWSGDRMLGRARPHPDERTFTLSGVAPGPLHSLSARAAGKRIDVAPPRSSRKAAALPPAAPPAAGGADPGLPGPYRTATSEYDLAPVQLEYPEKVETKAVVVAPVGASGKRPLALFLHGRHSVCYQGQSDDVPQQWPCPEGTLPIPSHRGYLQAQQLLASQGYLTVSVSANGINGQDWASEDGGAQARAELIRHHLALLAKDPRADLGKVLLVGHSRGGEGVNRAAMAPDPRWTVRGLLMIGPTLFGHNPVPDVPSATILPGCDGDVFDLQGQMYVDETRGVSRGKALHSALYMVGANHNYFNTEWTPGQSAAPSWDDFPSDQVQDAVCSPGTPTRLTAAQQQKAGATYIAAAARVFVQDDDRVLPLLDGGGVRAPSAGPARVLSHALGGNRSPVLLPAPDVRGVRICEQVTDVAARSCLDPDDINSRIGHFTTFGPVVPEPGRYAADLRWTSAGKPQRAVLPRPVRAETGRLALRVIVPPNSTGTAFGVSAVLAGGRRVALGDVRLDGLPGTELTTSYWAQEVRLTVPPLPVTALEFTPRTGSGRAIVLDAWAYGEGTPPPGSVSLPQLDVGTLDVVEGDSGSRTYQVPVTVSGRGAGQVRFFLVDAVSFEVTRTWLVTVDRSVSVPVTVTGDEMYGDGEGQYLLAKAERGFQIRDYIGGVTVENDDPEPVISAAVRSVRVAEGGALSWELGLSAPVETPYVVGAQPEPPASGAELSSTDVDPVWFQDVAWEDPEPSRPLSSTAALPWVFFEPGTATGSLVVPTIADALAEPDESVELHVTPDLVLTGTVSGS